MSMSQAGGSSHSLAIAAGGHSQPGSIICSVDGSFQPSRLRMRPLLTRAETCLGDERSYDSYSSWGARDLGLHWIARSHLAHPPAASPRQGTSLCHGGSLWSQLAALLLKGGTWE